MGSKMPTFRLSFNRMSASSMKAEARFPHLVGCSYEKGLYVCASSGFQTKLCGQSS